jgi:hypothetical protein
MDASDESAFIEALRSRIDDVRLICGGRWPSRVPPLVESFAECPDHFVYLWSPAVAPSLPSVARGQTYDGPQAGVVVQFQRSVLSATVLRAGRLAAGWTRTDEAMAAFVEAVWNALRDVTHGGLEVADGTPARTHRIGRSAARWSLEPEHVLTDYSVPVVYRVTASRDAPPR